MNDHPSKDVSGFPRLGDRLFATLLYLLPHHLLSQLMYWVTRNEWPLLKNWMIRNFIRIYGVEMEEATSPFPEDYASFNQFFTRSLQPDARPVAESEDAVVCPVDGTVSQAGTVNLGRIFQAKGQYYSLVELLGGGADWMDIFDGGSFATLYLSPRDYHRIHMPLDGRLIKMIHIPGRLFSVSPSTTRAVPRLFSRNERIVCLFETRAGPMAVIMVGALFVASMDTVWAGTVTPQSRRVTQWHYPGASTEPVSLEKGDELGRFNMGSTVILLFGRDAVTLEESLQPSTQVRMGEQMGVIPSTASDDISQGSG